MIEKIDDCVWERRLPVGAEVLVGGGAHFRVWAPRSGKVEVLLGGAGSVEDHEWRVELGCEDGEYFSGLVREARAGMRYRFLLDHGVFPDPASRFQPEGPHGASELVDGGVFEWTDGGWGGVGVLDRVIYELHVGTFTEEGTWLAARGRLGELAELGVTLVEVMPVADFPGERGWGYDGVNLFAPCRLYGRPDDFRAFVDEAHRLGMGVILDVVYNHMGPDGNYLPQFSANYFHKREVSDWGDTLNFDGEGSAGVRELFCSNAAYWIGEFHLDGLRLDAVHQIFDDSGVHFLRELTEGARVAGGGRLIYVVAENEAQQGHLVRDVGVGGYGLDAMWSDDFHHSAVVKMLGRGENFFMDYEGSCGEWAAVTEWGFLYQGQKSRWLGVGRGSGVLDLEPWNFVVFLQNHDQVANPAWGRRLHELVDGGTLRVATAWLLLGPNTPLLFQGQEFAAGASFYYFTDFKHAPHVAEGITKGRREQLRPFAGVVAGGGEGDLALNPEMEEAFRASVLCVGERGDGVHGQVWGLHRDLLRLRRESRLVGKCGRGGFGVDVLGVEGMLLRYFGGELGGDEMLLVNFGGEGLELLSRPLLAPPVGCVWEERWCSEVVEYGGEREEGLGRVELGAGYWLEARTAMWLVAVKV